MSKMYVEKHLILKTYFSCLPEQEKTAAEYQYLSKIPGVRVLKHEILPFRKPDAPYFYFLFIVFVARIWKKCNDSVNDCFIVAENTTKLREVMDCEWVSVQLNTNSCLSPALYFVMVL